MNPPTNLVARLRALIETVRTADLAQAEASGVDLERIAASLDEHHDALEPFAVDAVPTQIGLRHGVARVGLERTTVVDGETIGIFPYSPVTGELNPIAPPIRMWRDGETIRGSGRIPTSWNGPPAGVHGGFVAAILDELLGMAGVVSGNGGFTGTLSVRYIKPTPIDTDLELEAHVQSVDGRKVTITGQIAVAGEICATAEAVFIRPAELGSGETADVGLSIPNSD